MEMWKGERVVQSSFVFFLSLVRFELKRGTDLVGGHKENRVQGEGRSPKLEATNQFSALIANNNGIKRRIIQI